MLYQKQLTGSGTPAFPVHRSEDEVADQVTRGQRAKEFSSRVHRHLRGRWFSLVPVSRKAIVIFATTVLALPLLLGLLHHQTFTNAVLLAHPLLGYPFRLDKPDGFGAWCLSMLFMLSAGVCLLTYRLRLHRRDDYRGHYRLWRILLVACVIASVHSATNLLAWGGAWLELVFGQRSVMPGQQWLRIVIDVGGLVLAIRLIAEIHRCRAALVGVIVATLCFSVLELAHWKMFTVSSLLTSTLIASMPLAGCATLLFGMTCYLRMMFRQVRKLPDEPAITETLRGWFQRSGWQNKEQVSLDAALPDQPRPKLASRSAKPAAKPAAAANPTRKAKSPSAPSQVTAKAAEAKPSSTEDDASKSSKSALRSLFGKLKPKGRKPKPTDEADVASGTNDDSAKEKVPAKAKVSAKAKVPAKKKASATDTDSKSTDPPAEPRERSGSLFSRLKKALPSRKPKPRDESTAETTEEPKPADNPKRSGGLAGKVRSRFAAAKQKRQQAAGETDAADATPSTPTRKDTAAAKARNTAPAKPSAPAAKAAPKPARQPAPTAAKPTPQHAVEDEFDEDDIDWSSMSKAERRRMRKKMRRGNNAA
ncbi:hypothetical protein SV7mr_04610 [Stieleria bergensis]|uniref:Uncharacterized protein n=1 Tax=Stieleria bergensis TaxID=2528025 RepID=A0A517SPC1_9BACT|nr:hypothetical protein SV7mr_04610 [Planctomycetes bacterium SV_7m_r]